MIASRKNSKGKHYNYRELGEYCRDAKHQGEKCLMSWYVGCDAPSYDMALEEIAITQARNITAKSDKTYHLIISFREGDEEKLSSEVYKDIEENFAQALGLSEHQRTCGVHKNTANLHIHVAYNLIHPETFKMATTIFQDFPKLSKVCREMELKYGLKVDNGYEQRKVETISQKAASVEAHTGEFSFQSYALLVREAVIARINTISEWQDVHDTLDDYGIAILPKKGGFVLISTEGKGTMKASAFDKSMSRANLEKRFGAYIENKRKEEISPDQSTITTETQQHGEINTELQSIDDSDRFRHLISKNKKELLDKIASSQNWQEVHEILFVYGIYIRRVGNGLVFTDEMGHIKIKASSVDRMLSKMNLEKRLGKFEEFEKAMQKDGENLNQRSSQDIFTSSNQNDVKSHFIAETLKQRNIILKKINDAKNWQDVHKLLADIGLRIKPVTNGLVFTDIAGKYSIKASTVSRTLSKKQLEKRFGLFASDVSLQQPEEREEETTNYQPRPKQPRSPERDKLYKSYQAELARKNARIEAEKERSKSRFDFLRKQWQQKQTDLHRYSINKASYYASVQVAYKLYKEKVDIERKRHQKAMQLIRNDYQWYNWNGFLQHLAVKGNMEALAVLRSIDERKELDKLKKCPAQEDTPLVTKPSDKELVKQFGGRWNPKLRKWCAPKGSDLALFEQWLGEADREKLKAAKSAVTVPKIHKSPEDLLSLLVNAEIASASLGCNQKINFAGYRYRIDNRGVAIITLPNGGIIRDNGSAIYFEKSVRKAAQLYAQVKFGKHFRIRGNTISQRKQNGIIRILKPCVEFLRQCARNGMRKVPKLDVVFNQPVSNLLLQNNVRNNMGRGR